MRPYKHLYLLIFVIGTFFVHFGYAQPILGMPGTTPTLSPGTTISPNTMGSGQNGAITPGQTGQGTNISGVVPAVPNSNIFGTVPIGITPPDSASLLPNYEQRMKELEAKGIVEKELAEKNAKKQDSIINELRNSAKQELLLPNKLTMPSAPVTPKLPRNTAILTQVDSSIITIINQDTIRYLSYNQDSARFDTLIYIKPTITPKKTLEQLVASAVYGHHLFLKPPKITPADSTSFVPSDDYIIQPGDEFGVSAWNETYISDFLKVETDGAVSRQYVGRIFVGGLTYKDARNLMERAYSRFLPDGAKIKVRLVKNTKTQNAVTIVGEVKQDGTFYLPPYATIFDALYAAGGITELGTVRNIYVKRSGKTIKTLDLYDYLINGNIEPIYLQNGDYVFVPVTGDIVRIQGAVKRPLRYEMKENETIQDLVKYAGGFTGRAYTSSLQLTRFENDEKKIITAAYKSGQRLQDGDIVDVSLMSDQMFNFVEIKGSVIRPDQYQFQQGMSVNDLVRLAGGYMRTAHLDKAYLVRIPKVGKIEYLPVNLNSDNPLLKPMDLLVVLDDTIFNKRNYIEVKGEVRKKGTFQTSPTMTLKDVLYLAEGLKESAKLENLELGYFSYKGEKDKDPNVFNKANNQEIPITITRRIAVKGKWQEDPQLDTILVRDYRYLNVYSKYDYIEEYKINVLGAVKKGGSFKLNKTMTVKDLLYLVGGPSKDADYNNVELSYYSPKGRGDDPNRVTETEKGEIPYVETKTIRFAINPNWEKDSLIDTMLVHKYRFLKVYSRFEYLDEYSIKVDGEVRKPSSFPLHPSMTLKDLFYMVGGPKPNADYSNIELGYYRYEGADKKDFNYSLKTEKGEFPLIQTKTVRISINPDWKNDPMLDTLNVYKYRYVTVYSKYEDFVVRTIQVSGAFKETRAIQTNPTLTLKDVFFMCGIQPNADLSSIELRYYKDIKDYKDRDMNEVKLAEIPKESAILRIVSAKDDWRNDSSLDTILVNKYNFIKIYSKEDFVLNRSLNVSGIVQKPQTISLSKGLSLKDVLYLCEGIKLSEESAFWLDLYYYVPKTERGNLNLKAKTDGIRRLRIGHDWRNDTSLDSLPAFPYEKIIVRSQSDFMLEGDAEIKGAVNNPTKFSVPPQMTLKDVLYLASGVKIETDYNNIEISRVLNLENTNGEIETTPVKVQKVTIAQDWQNDPKLDSIFIYPYDYIYVRPNPNFKLQQNVLIEGEIMVPGEYPKLRQNERISSLVKRAGGINKVGFPAGAKLIRKVNPIWEIQKQGRLQSILQKERIRSIEAQQKQDDILKAKGISLSSANSETENSQMSKALAKDLGVQEGEDLISIQLDKAIKRPGGRYDLVLQEGDRIIVPPAKQTVEIRGNVLDSTQIVVFDKRNTSFKNYVNLAGGFSKRTDRSECVVIYPNGTSRKAQQILLWHKYPKVTDGSVIYVPRKPESKNQNLIAQFSQFGPTLKELTADAMSILSLILLVRTLTQ